MEIIVKINKDITKYADLVYDASSLNRMLYEQRRYDKGKSYGSDGLLILFANYMSNKKSGMSSQHADYYQKDIENYKKRIEDLIEKIYNEIEKIEAKM